MIHSFKSFINELHLFKPGDRILLAVSGGIDSVVMTELFEKSGFKYSIAHCNFHLRGAASDGEALFVEKLAKKNKVKFHLAHFDTKKFASQQKISLQMAARELRINWLENLLKNNKYPYYATAHHQDDQIETFFINLLRGTGITGLRGMLPRQGNLIHPMLFTCREDIVKFAENNNIDFREDSSNQLTDYTRNKIRLQLIPVINKIKPGYRRIFIDNINRLQQAERIYHNSINFAQNIIQRKDGQYKIPIQSLLDYVPVETYLYEMISPFGFNQSTVKRILKSIADQPGRKFYSKSHVLYKDRNFLIIEKTNEQSEIKEFKIKKGSMNISRPLRLKLSIDKPSPVYINNDNKNIAYLDAEKITFPLTIRNWRKGDCFYPLGMNKRKLLSDFFINNKISIPDKRKIWILTSGNQIVWVIGQRIDNRFKISSLTQNMLKIEYIL